MTASVDPGYRLLAAKYIRKQARQLTARLDGVCTADDIESVHQARVASRRLRAAMRMFPDCFGKKRSQRWRKAIRRITASLGDARDKDMQIAFLQGALSGLDDDLSRPGIVRLLAKLERDRERLQPEVMQAARRMQSRGVLRDMIATATPVVAEAKARGINVRTDAALREAGRHVLSSLDQLHGYQASLDDESAAADHHAMRIAAKRLRYTTEIAGPVYGRPLGVAVEVIKQLQSLLGDIHDCDVWCENLTRFAAGQRRRILKYFGHGRPFARLAVGLDGLRQQRIDQRRALFVQLVDYWARLDQAGFWERFGALVSGHRGPPLEVISRADEPVEEPATVEQSAAGAEPPGHSAMAAPHVRVPGMPADGERRRPDVRPATQTQFARTADLAARPASQEAIHP